MNLLTEIINSLKQAAQDAGCDGVIMRAEIKLTVSGAPVVVEIPIAVCKLPNDPSSATRQPWAENNQKTL